MTRRRLPGFALALASVALANCGASTRTASKTDGSNSMEGAKLTRLHLTSDAFEDGKAIPAQYTCDGANQSPPLKWGEPPQGTKSFALIVEDPGSPSGTFGHWGTYDIPPSARSLRQGQTGGPEAINDFEKQGFGGPCPPKGHGPHHYHFKLFALATDKLALPVGSRVAAVETAARSHAIGEGELIGTYERK